MSVRIALFRYDVRRFIKTGMWQKLAHRVPRRLAYFCYVRVMAHAWAELGNKHPDEIGYGQACSLWGEPSL